MFLQVRGQSDPLSIARERDFSGTDWEKKGDSSRHTDFFFLFVFVSRSGPKAKFETNSIT